MLWTFVVEYKGGTYINQFSAPDINTAIGRYNEADPSGKGAIPLDCEAVEVETTLNVYCTTGLDEGDEFIMATIIKTVQIT